MHNGSAFLIVVDNTMPSRKQAEHSSPLDRKQVPLPSLLLGHFARLIVSHFLTSARQLLPVGKFVIFQYKYLPHNDLNNRQSPLARSRLGAIPYTTANTTGNP
jgi:hypothetical protein